MVRRGKGGKRREVGMDRWACEQLSPWLELRGTLPVGALFCALRGPTCEGIDNTEIVHAVHERPAPMIPATRGL